MGTHTHTHTHTHTQYSNKNNCSPSSFSVSPSSLERHLYVKSPTYKLKWWTFKDVHLCSHIQSCKLVYISGVHCHVQLALHFLMLTILLFCHLSPPLPPPVFFLPFALMPTPICLLLYYTFQSTVLLRLKMFYFLFFFLMYYLCEKYYKPIIV